VTELTPELADRLVRQFTAAVQERLQPDELAFLATVAPLSITAAALDGDLVVKIRLYGQETFIGWDGTEADAVECVMGIVDSAADNISDGYWMTGGWKTRTTSSSGD
jgi:hypothetical protein